MIVRLVMSVMLAFASSAALAQTQRWLPGDVRELVQAIEQAAADGLDPADYDLATLNAAIASGDALQIDTSASAHFRHLAADRWEGHVRGARRIDWHIVGPLADAADYWRGTPRTDARSLISQRRRLFSAIPQTKKTPS